MANVTYDSLLEQTLGLNERAEFSFLPRFKDDPSLKKLKDATKDAEHQLNSEGYKTKNGGEKVANALLRITDCIFNISDTIALPGCIFVVVIPFYLLDRLIEWALKYGQEEVAKSRATKAIGQLKKAAEKTEDKKTREELNKTIEKMQKRMEDLEKYDSEN